MLPAAILAAVLAAGQRPPLVPGQIPTCTVLTFPGVVCRMPDDILRTPMSVQNPADPTNWISVRALGIWIGAPTPGISYPADALRRALRVRVEADYISPALGQAWTEVSGFTMGGE
jgi:hypothetical protein